MTPEELIKQWRERADHLNECVDALKDDIRDAIVRECRRSAERIITLRQCADELEAALKEGEQE